MKWISVKDRMPKKGQIIVVWLSRQKEPSCVTYDEDEQGPIYWEFVEVPREMDREDLVSHWLLLPEPPKD
jgi:hypothetical protein